MLYPKADLAANESGVARLDKHSRARGCVYVRRLRDIGIDVVEELFRVTLSAT